MRTRSSHSGNQVRIANVRGKPKKNKKHNYEFILFTFGITIQ